MEMGIPCPVPFPCVYCRLRHVFAGNSKTLLVEGIPLHLCVNGVRGPELQGQCLVGKGLHKNLHIQKESTITLFSVFAGML